MSETMNDDAVDLRILAHRMKHIEQENARLAAEGKRMRLLLALTLIVGGAVFLTSLVPANTASGALQQTPRIVRASAFMIVDRNGTERGSFGYNDAEQAAYLILEANKSGRVNLVMSRDAVDLRLTRGKNDINLGCSKKGGTYIELFDKDGKSMFEQRKP